jgi:hypothetical protein
MSIAAILASTAYQQDLGLVSVTRPASQFIGLPLPAPIKADLESLSTALQEGDLKQAQTAFSALVADMAAEYQRQEDSVSISS